MSYFELSVLILLILICYFMKRCSDHLGKIRHFTWDPESEQRREKAAHDYILHLAEIQRSAVRGSSSKAEAEEEVRKMRKRWREDRGFSRW